MYADFLVEDGLRWEIPDPSALLSEEWGDETVLFDARSGQTHLLNALATEALSFLQERAASLDELAQYLATLFEVPLEEPFAAEIRRLLEQCVQLGLIEPCRR